METVFITIHDLSLDARIKFCSDSIEDILGYTPSEVKGKSCWEYFHPDEIPFAREIHGRGIDLDKAAVLNYCQIKHKDGTWIGCECVFTIVHDVLVASTAVYKRGPKAQRRALEGANVRRIFSSSPKDPRYHMLSYLSNKFYQQPEPHREPRAALFLNRFTRTSTIMFATSGVSTILGLSPEQLTGKSFYYCIAENCLPEAVKCLESAKANDSIAYLRFWYRDPTQANSRPPSEMMRDASESEEEEEGGVRLGSVERSSVERSSVEMRDPSQTDSRPSLSHANSSDAFPPIPDTNADTPHLSAGDGSQMNENLGLSHADSTRSSSGHSTDLGGNANDAIFDPPAMLRSTSSYTPVEEDPAVEIEAVVSCTSDGLMVILRRARPLVPQALSDGDAPYYRNGLFASPWAPEPVMPQEMQQATAAPQLSFPSGGPQPIESGFMAAIRDVAVFAWSLTGINGSLSQYSRGSPSGDSTPPGGLPIWDPDAPKNGANEAYNGFSGSAHRPLYEMGESENDRSEDLTSSDDEVLWKRAPTMTEWRRPKRRAHNDAFGEDEYSSLDGGSSDGARKRSSKVSADIKS